MREALNHLRPVFEDANRTKCENCRENFNIRYREFFENKDSKIANEVFHSNRAAKRFFVCASCSTNKANEKKHHLMETRRDRKEERELNTPQLHFLGKNGEKKLAEGAPVRLTETNRHGAERVLFCSVQCSLLFIYHPFHLLKVFNLLIWL